MTTLDRATPAAPASSQWLRTYYFTRAAVSIGWIGLVVAVGRSSPLAAAVLLVAYPAWDALANALDARRSGGLRASPSQALNLAISLGAALGVGVALMHGMNAVLAVFGAWASLSGLLQLATAVRRWKSAGAQWAMALSGVQSALAGGFFIKMAADAASPAITSLAPYAAFGAFYFLVSALWLTFKAGRERAV